MLAALAEPAPHSPYHLIGFLSAQLTAPHRRVFVRSHKFCGTVPRFSMRLAFRPSALLALCIALLQLRRDDTMALML